MKHNVKVNIGGRFKMQAVRPDGTVRELAPWQDNLITNLGLNYLSGWTTTQNSQTSSMISNLAVGTGSTPPTVADEQLESMLAINSDYVDKSEPNSTEAPYFIRFRRTFVFKAGSAAGNLTELGLCQKDGPSGTRKRWFFSRALIKNEAGDPITVTVLPDEILQVTYEIRVYLLDISDRVYTVMDGTTPVQITARPHGLGRGTNTWPSFDSNGSISKFESYLWGPQWMKGTDAIQPIATSNARPGTTVTNSNDQNNPGWGWNRTIGTPGTTMWADISIARGEHRDIRYLVTLSSPTFNWSFGFDPPLNKAIDEVLRVEFSYTYGRYDA